MLPSKDRLLYLFECYFQKTATPEESLELLQLIEQGKQDRELQALLTAVWERYQGDGEIIRPERSEAMLQSIFRQSIPVQPAPVRTMRRRPVVYWKVAAAAAIILLLVSVSWLWLQKEDASSEASSLQANVPIGGQPIQPGTNGAILTLDNGQVIVLDSAGNGLLAQQGGSRVIKQEEGLSYLGHTQGSETVYNTLTTPKGRQYPNLVLADGTKVWLDAESSIRFPVAFSGKERRVEITGQVWFDVVHDEKNPFIVMAKGVPIYDLGTEFNVNAYGDEPDLKVSLLQGVVQIHSTRLRPGQQARVQSDGSLTVKDNVDLDEVIAWKKGVFNFNHADLKSVMRQLARWYDIEVRYQGAVPNVTFGGEIGRNLTLQEVLEGLAFLNLKFKIEGRTLVVMP